MYGYIYITTNLINQKVYIGQKKSNTFLGHTYLGSGNNIRKAIQKYGSTNFNVKLIETCNTFEELNKREIYWISYYRNKLGKTNVYNISKGSQYYEGSIPTQETRRKQSLHNKGKIRSKDCKDRMKRVWKETHKDINFKTNTKRKCMYYQTTIKYIKEDEIETYLQLGWKFGNPKNKGRIKPHSEETKRKIGNAHKGKIISEEQRRKISKTLRNKSKSSSTIENIV